MYHKEIMKMGCDFYQDDNGKVWFFYAKNILTRRLPSAPEVSWVSRQADTARMSVKQFKEDDVSEIVNPLHNREHTTKLQSMMSSFY